jgi:hypothetical protein
MTEMPKLKPRPLSADQKVVVAVKAKTKPQIKTKPQDHTKTQPKQNETKPEEVPKTAKGTDTYMRWICGEQLLISKSDNTYIYDPKDYSLIGRVLDESNIEWY